MVFAPVGADDNGVSPVEVASHFFTGVNDPRVGTMDFSLDGRYFISSHADDALRLIDVLSMRHNETIQLEAFGVHCARFTQSSDVVCVAPRYSSDGHLYLLSLTSAQLFSAMAFVSDDVSELRAVSNTPVYSTISQSPQSDVIASVFSTQGRLLLFHPLISGAIAASGERTVLGSRAAVSFSPDGTKLVVGDDHRVHVFDYRKMFSAPLVSLENKTIFTESSAASRCKGAEVNADGSHLLLTSSGGEAVVYSLKQGRVACSYFHNVARRHFIGAGDAVGAKFVFPNLTSSPVVQLSTCMNAGRHLLVYDGYDGQFSGSCQRGALKYELQCRDSDVPVALSVNSKYALLATAARGVTWWSFNA
ncbi:COMPASS component SWD2 [Trypanosoma conorhini]|uniref:COMPASS component SWD2 n=1 Tax=Trypanosoma conorhini TaxID=83891 RepID=A0A3R7LFS1_9TRYP|nr:COMPASS component SWD2 [Trypanosoma conorhini]RNF27532.1 COMPASS component SWD2 [Trypanosoma conorhini]